MLMAGNINIKLLNLKLAWKNYMSQHLCLAMCFWSIYIPDFTCLPQMVLVISIKLKA